jgi:photosystem II stability/assembly factor-like uncharacterized protein
MSDRLYVATRKGMFTLERGSSGWGIARIAFLGDPVGIVTHDPRDGWLYCALELGHFGPKLQRSADGETWEECAIPTYPKAEAAEGEEATAPALDRIWSLVPGGPGEDALLWAGTIPGGLFRSHDRGTTWELITALWDHPKRTEWFGGGAEKPGIHSVCVDPRDSRHVTVGVSCGGAWTTRDGGETWQNCAEGMRAEYMPPEGAYNPNIQDPHCIANCAADPDVFWCQHHNGVFRSTDDCASWQEITEAPPANFGFPIAVHPLDPETAWRVPAVKDEKRYAVDGGVCATRTRDGGKTWEVLRNGLPQVHAYDLVYRHSLDVDRFGNQLAFGSTTGNLWLSEDQGDTWQNLSTSLPPIYCVRFAS